jgi:hypothetical protein
MAQTRQQEVIHGAVGVFDHAQLTGRAPGAANRATSARLRDLYPATAFSLRPHLTTLPRAMSKLGAAPKSSLKPLPAIPLIHQMINLPRILHAQFARDAPTVKNPCNTAIPLTG